MRMPAAMVMEFQHMSDPLNLGWVTSPKYTLLEALAMPSATPVSTRPIKRGQRPCANANMVHPTIPGRLSTIRVVLRPSFSSIYPASRHPIGVAMLEILAETKL